MQGYLISWQGRVAVVKAVVGPNRPGKAQRVQLFSMYFKDEQDARGQPIERAYIDPELRDEDGHEVAFSALPAADRHELYRLVREAAGHGA